MVMEKDPVCKMNVSEDKPKATETYKGKTYYFCSSGCKNTFDRNRDLFIGKP
jgi:Cu+-exporting ATPase